MGIYSFMKRLRKSSLFRMFASGLGVKEGKWFYEMALVIESGGEERTGERCIFGMVFEFISKGA